MSLNCSVNEILCGIKNYLAKNKRKQSTQRNKRKKTYKTVDKPYNEMTNKIPIRFPLQFQVERIKKKSAILTHLKSMLRFYTP